MNIIWFHVPVITFIAGISFIIGISEPIWDPNLILGKKMEWTSLSGDIPGNILVLSISFCDPDPMGSYDPLNKFLISAVCPA